MLIMLFYLIYLEHAFTLKIPYHFLDIYANKHVIRSVKPQRMQ